MEFNEVVMKERSGYVKMYGRKKWSSGKGNEDVWKGKSDKEGKGI